MILYDLITPTFSCLRDNGALRNYLNSARFYTVLTQVEGIVGFKQVRGAPHYKVRWLGYSSRHDTWEPASNLTPCDDLIEEYHSRTAVAKTEVRIES